MFLSCLRVEVQSKEQATVISISIAWTSDTDIKRVRVHTQTLPFGKETSSSLHPCRVSYFFCACFGVFPADRGWEVAARLPGHA